MASGCIWGICFPPIIQVGAYPQTGTKIIYCRKLDIQLCLLSKVICTVMFQSFATYKIVCFLTSQCLLLLVKYGEYVAHPLFNWDVTPDRYRDHLLSKVRYTIMFPSLAA